MSVPDESFDPVLLPPAELKQDVFSEGIQPELLLDDGGKTVNAPAHVCSSRRDIDLAEKAGIIQHAADPP